MPIIKNTLEQLRQKVSDIELLEREKSALDVLLRYPTILEGFELSVSVTTPSAETLLIDSIGLKNLYTPSEITSKAIVRRAIVQASIDQLLGNGIENFPHE